MQTITTNHPIVLGITGEHSSGKTTVAKLLEESAHARVMAFSDGIYAEVAHAFNCSIVDLASHLVKTQPQRMLALQHCADKAFVQCALEHAQGDLQTSRSPQQILNWWANEYRRKQDPAYWLEFIRSRIASLRMHNCTRPVVLADVRMRNEAEMIRNMGGTIWRIERPTRQQRNPSTTSSEHLQIQADLTLHNIADIGHLQHLVLTQWHELQRYGHHASAST